MRNNTTHDAVTLAGTGAGVMPRPVMAPTMQVPAPVFGRICRPAYVGQITGSTATQSTYAPNTGNTKLVDLQGSKPRSPIPV
ncbi:MAG TPA: hypothetical protein VGN54_09335 [Mycobacteriales bacterium]|jgi:hypothetical protein|nr:hypothetical protein [Mycobacteriales bacterium]